MLTEIYIEALLVDEELADQVWEAWDAGFVSNELAALAWWLLTPSFGLGLPAGISSSSSPALCASSASIAKACVIISYTGFSSLLNASPLA